LTPGGNSFSDFPEYQSDIISLDCTFCLLDCSKLVGLYSQNMHCTCPTCAQYTHNKRIVFVRSTTLKKNTGTGTEQGYHVPVPAVISGFANLRGLVTEYVTAVEPAANQLLTLF